MTTTNSQHDLLPNGIYTDPMELAMSVARMLDKTHWSPEMFERIFRAYRDAGFDIREPSEKSLPQ